MIKINPRGEPKNHILRANEKTKHFETGGVNVMLVAHYSTGMFATMASYDRDPQYELHTEVELHRRFDEVEPVKAVIKETQHSGQFYEIHRGVWKRVGFDPKKYKEEELDFDPK